MAATLLHIGLLCCSQGPDVVCSCFQQKKSSSEKPQLASPAQHQSVTYSSLLLFKVKVTVRWIISKQHLERFDPALSACSFAILDFKKNHICSFIVNVCLLFCFILYSSVKHFPCVWNVLQLSHLHHSFTFVKWPQAPLQMKDAAALSSACANKQLFKTQAYYYLHSLYCCKNAAHLSLSCTHKQCESDTHTQLTKQLLMSIDLWAFHYQALDKAVKTMLTSCVAVVVVVVAVSGAL